MHKINSLESEHSDMVRELIKSPEEIFRESNPAKMELVHAVVGLTGELIELVLFTDRENLTEEAGDTLFYLKALRFSLSLPDYDGSGPFLDAKLQVVDAGPETGIALPQFVEISLLLLDMMKKIVIFNQASGEKFRNKFLAAANTADFLVENVLKLEGIPDARNTALQHNMRKLKTGPKARYAGGYSDAAAEARVDKTPD